MRSGVSQSNDNTMVRNTRQRAIRVLTIGLLVVLCALLSAPMQAHARTYGVVVAGLGGEPAYSDAFAESSRHYAEALRSLDKDPTLIISLDEGATREQILEAISQQASRLQSDVSSSEDPVTSDTQFVLILTGHGNAGKNTWRFNIAGPDITSDDLIAALNGVTSTRQLVVLAASASGAALESMSQLGRVLVTATKSGGELNAVRFHEFLAEATQNEVADYDRNEILTIAEAYRFAEARTGDYYEQQKLLASEHARLRGDQADEVAIALLGSLQEAIDDPVVAALLDERLTLEQVFKSLKARKPDIPVEQYYQELESLLLSIARLQQSIDKETGWSDNDADS